MPPYILSLDQGTTSSRAIIFDHSGNMVSIAQKEFAQIYPHPGWVEHDPAQIWSTQLGVAVEAVSKAGLSARELAAIGITNQRETTIVWDRDTGEPVYHAIVWQDRRTAAYCDELKRRHGRMIQEKTGLIVDAYFSATKIRWILDNVQGLKERAAQGKLAFGTVDTWLIWKLTGGRVHATDISNASRTMFFNIHTCDWDQELLDLFQLPSGMLPELRGNSEVIGYTSSKILAAEIPIAGVAGDQQAALFGQMCTTTGMVKNTYGTGCFMLMNIGDKPILSKQNLVTTIAWKINGKVQYALEGSIFIGGAVVQWLRDGLGIIKNSGDVESLAAKVEDSGGVFLVPAFAGLGAPHWNQYARGTITGLTRGSTSAHIARAALESIALQTMDVLTAMQSDSGIAIRELRVDGGATSNELLMQIQANVLQAKVIRPTITETTAVGAAYLAGLGIGYWKTLDEIQQHWKIDSIFSPVPGKSKELVSGWQRAIKAAIAWAEG